MRLDHRRPRLLSAVALLIFSTTLLSTSDAAAADATKPADNWVFLGKSNGECKHFWDPSTLSMSDGKRKAWFLISCAGAGAFPSSPRGVMSKAVLNQFDCAKRSLAVAQATAYRQQFGSGEVVLNSQQAVTESVFEDVAPNSVGMAYVTEACSAKLPAQ